ncbi:toxin-activating lysine-acyltransferase [Octadecabacter sp. G9-8]|uniref:RTX toxin-activating lysine-acyltransferase n=1 Tax=Octadecabacter dasysiphoniae TaxID=2909341 RepID=A0ABS9D161_9RHOB|nr:toxin-activating lysine-acyltransferase [Octadecabacter dasysiphoniae]
MTKKKTGRVDASEKTADAANPETLAQIAQVRTKVRENFGTIAMAMMALSRYRHNSISDLQHLVLEPLLLERVALAYAPGDDATDIAGMAFWASVSEDVDKKIKEQIRAGAFPIRLKADEWNSGDINWLFDVISPDQMTTARVLANFKQVVKDGDLRLHPLIGRLVDPETLKKMGAQTGAQVAAAAASGPSTETVQ